jgi:acetyl esterase/lipase
LRIIRHCRLPDPAEDRTEHLDLAYSDVGQLDLAAPPGPGPHPAVLLVHGGGWRSGKRHHMRREMRVLTGAGFAAGSLDYRLASPRRPSFPDAVADVRCAVRWLAANARRFRIDPRRIAIAGTSAGGHLAALAALADDARLDDGRCPAEGDAEVAALVAYFAPFDLRPSVTFEGAKGRVVARFLGAPPREDPARSTLASPIAHVDPADPPVLLVHGSEDPTVDPGQSRRMWRELRRQDVGRLYVEVPGAGHGFPLLSRQPRHRIATCTTLAFLDAVLHPGR